ncbi:hypothetical protein [Geopseudomonas aromaticivorans]
MFIRGNALPSPDDSELNEMALRKRLAGLKLAGPLMGAALERPGLTSPEDQEAILTALGALIARTRDMVARIVESLKKPPFNIPNASSYTYKIAQEVVDLVAEHWMQGSEVPPQTLEQLVISTMQSAPSLLEVSGSEGSYNAGDERSERIASGVMAATRIAVGMSGVSPLGHDLMDLCKAFMSHLAERVRYGAEKIKGEQSTPVLQAMTREFTKLYIQTWYAEVVSVKKMLNRIDSPAEREALIQDRTRNALSDVLRKVEVAGDLLLDMAIDMETIVRPERATEDPDRTIEGA